MSLEQAIEKLTAAVEANTAALLKSGGTTASAGKTETKPVKESKAEKYEAKHTKDEMMAVLSELKKKAGGDAEVPKKIIKEIGGADKMADINDAAKIDAVYEAAKKKMAELDDGGDGL